MAVQDYGGFIARMVIVFPMKLSHPPFTTPAAVFRWMPCPAVAGRSGLSRQGVLQAPLACLGLARWLPF